MEITKMNYFCGLHIGAGYHSRGKEKYYNELMTRACNKATEELKKKDGTAMRAVAMAIEILENDRETNCGFGSNLNEQGYVECDASMIELPSEAKGSCGAVAGIKNPILLAEALCRESKMGRMPCGRERPIFLVSDGAADWAKSRGLQFDRDKMISSESKKKWQKYKKLVDEMSEKKKRKRHQSSELLDTVGVICLDSARNLVIGTSSGGIAMKKVGRIGPAACFGIGSYSKLVGSDYIGICASGRGEDIIRSELSRECVIEISKENEIHTAIKKLFLGCINKKDPVLFEAGIMGLKVNKENNIQFFTAFTTPSMGVAYCSNSEPNPKAQILRNSQLLPESSLSINLTNIKSK